MLLAAGVIALGIYLVALGVRTAMVPAAFFAAVFIYGSATGRWVQFRGRPPRK